MAESSFLGGRVLKRSLPALSAPAGPEAPALKRLLLPQGELAQICDGDEGIHYLASIELRSGTVRGNHYHRVKEEYLYIISGEVLLVVQDTDTQERATVPLQAGDLAFIQTRVAHALKVLQPGVGVEFSAVRFDPADIQRVQVIEGQR
jgi:mannose-6-phosphate isomerase-like protein (cupin superfamily)